MKVKIKKLHPNAIIPKYATEGSAAVDLCARLDSDIYLYPGEVKFISTGLSLEFEQNVACVIIPRSGLGAKHGIVLANLVGLCDSDYRGDYTITAWNRNTEGTPYKISNGDRLCQAIFIPIHKMDFEIVTELSDTYRGEGGFGHSGVSSG